jgi:hypothetical protein
MFKAASRKLLHQFLVPQIQRFLLANPAQSFRMARITAPAIMLGQNIPQAMQLAMLGQQMFPT